MDFLIFSKRSKRSKRTPSNTGSGPNGEQGFPHYVVRKRPYPELALAHDERGSSSYSKPGKKTASSSCNNQIRYKHSTAQQSTAQQRTQKAIPRILNPEIPQDCKHHHTLSLISYCLSLHLPSSVLIGQLIGVSSHLSTQSRAHNATLGLHTSMLTAYLPL